MVHGVWGHSATYVISSANSKRSWVIQEEISWNFLLFALKYKASLIFIQILRYKDGNKHVKWKVGFDVVDVVFICQYFIVCRASATSVPQNMGQLEKNLSITESGSDSDQ